MAEEHLKSCGLPYSIVRPGGLLAGTESATGGGILVAGDPNVSVREHAPPTTTT